MADDLWFVQVLEGAQNAVWKTFEKIRSDPRHRAVTILDVRGIEARSFAEWNMTLALRTPETNRIFAAYGAQTSFNPPRMTTGQLLNLLHALANSNS